VRATSGSRGTARDPGDDDDDEEGSCTPSSFARIPASPLILSNLFDDDRLDYRKIKDAIRSGAPILA